MHTENMRTLLCAYTQAPQLWVRLWEGVHMCVCVCVLGEGALLSALGENSSSELRVEWEVNGTHTAGIE